MTASMRRRCAQSPGRNESCGERNEKGPLYEEGGCLRPAQTGGEKSGDRPGCPACPQYYLVRINFAVRGAPSALTANRRTSAQPLGAALNVGAAALVTCAARIRPALS